MENLLWWKRGASIKWCFMVILSISVALTEPKKTHIVEVEEFDQALEDNRVASLKSLECYHSFDNNTCVTPECVSTATRILEYMDSNVDPCDDFYQFACGNFIKHKKIADGQKFVSTFSLARDAVSIQIKTFLEEDLIISNEFRPFELAKRYYQACMNTRSIEKSGLVLIKSILKDVGGWPVIEGKKWNAKEFDWKKTTYELRKVGLDFGFLANVVTRIEPNDTSRFKLSIEPPDFNIPNKTNLYFSFMVDVAVIFGANRTKAKQDLKQSLEFERKLSEASRTAEGQQISDKRMTVVQLQTEFPSIPWLEYLNSVVGVPDVKIKSFHTLLVKSPTYISELEKIIANSTKRAQANYIIWNVIENVVPYLTEELQQRYDKYHNKTSANTSRWKKCFDEVSARYFYSVGGMYIKRYFDIKAKERGLEMVTNLKNEFIKLLESAQWMDGVTRKHAFDKLYAIKPFIAQSIDLFSEPKLAEYYANFQFNFTSDNFLKMFLNVNLFNLENYYKTILHPLNITEAILRRSPFDVNAYYHPEINSIRIPIGILQGAFFNQDRPQYMNYGIMGYTIGHEITHGFDTKGRLYDKDGNIVDWWTPSASKAFKERAQCLVEQYGNYTIPEIDAHVNGLKTLGENIADNGGIKTAYMAYNTWAKQNGEEQQLPCLNYTTRQLFWISAGQKWCEILTPEGNLIMLEDVHSFSRFRVIGPLSNSPYFAKDFHCPCKTKMNPAHKCVVW